MELTKSAPANVDIRTWTDREKAGIVDGVEDVLAWFFKACAGTTSCAIHEGTPEAVGARYDRIMELTRVNSTAIAPTDTRPRDPMSPDDWVSSRIGPEDYAQCNDWGPWPDDSLEKLAVELGEAKRRHRLPGRDIEWSWSCVGKDVSGDRFLGPFGGRTAHPILFSNRRLDMATPWSAAKRNSGIFEGSRVLTIEGVGVSVTLCCSRQGTSLTWLSSTLSTKRTGVCGVITLGIWSTGHFLMRIPRVWTTRHRSGSEAISREPLPER